MLKTCTSRLQLRSQHKAFHPQAEQAIVDLGPELFVVVRKWKREKVVCISNFTAEYRELKIDDRLGPLNRADSCSDILTGNRFMGEGKVIALEPYQTVWLLF